MTDLAEQEQDEIDSLEPPEAEEDEIRRELAVQAIKSKYQNFRAGLLKNQLNKALLVKVKDTSPAVSKIELPPIGSASNSRSADKREDE